MKAPLHPYTQMLLASLPEVGVRHDQTIPTGIPGRPGVFQDPFSSYNPIYKADRVFESIRGVYFRRMPPQAWHDKIESALHGVALNPGDVLGKYPHQLSGGQQQRLLIARALLLDVNCSSPTRSSACWTRLPGSTSSTCSSA